MTVMWLQFKTGRMTVDGAHSKAENMDLRCSFCGAARSEVERLVTSDAGSYICDGCVRTAEAAVANGTASNDRVTFTEVKCSFCGLPAHRSKERPVAARDLTICGECVALCAVLFESAERGMSVEG